MWAHLPNAKHIDRIMESIRLHPEYWDCSDIMRKSASLAKFISIAEVTGRAAATYGAYNKLRKLLRKSSRKQSRFRAHYPIVALIANDDCAQMLDCDLEEVKVLIALGSEVATLMYPACIAFSKEKNK